MEAYEGLGFIPGHVVVNSDGLAVPAEEALSSHNVIADVVYVDYTGWSIGAVAEFEQTLLDILGERDWKFIFRRKDDKWIREEDPGDESGVS